MANNISQKNLIFMPDLKSVKLENEKILFTSIMQSDWIVLDSRKGNSLLMLFQSGKSLEEQDFLSFLDKDELQDLCEIGFVGYRTDKGDIFLNYDKEIRNKKMSLFILHLTNKCNLMCKYCFANADSKKEKSISNDKISKILKIIQNTDSALMTETIAIEFNSGEIFLNKKELFYGVKNILRLFKDDKRNVNIPIQTNGTIFTKEISRFLYRYGLQISVSYDGPKEIHDKNRIFAPNYEDILTLSDYIIGFKLNPIYTCGRQERIKDEDKFYHSVGLAYLEAFEKFIYHDMFNVTNDKFIMPFDNMIHFIYSVLFAMNPYMCKTFPCGAGINQFTFAPDGEIYPCQEFLGKKNFSLGNINALSDLNNLPNTYDGTILSERELCAECAECPWFIFCRNSCVAHSINANGNISGKIPDCEYYKVIFEFLINKISNEDKNLQIFIDKYVISDRYNKKDLI